MSSEQAHAALLMGQAAIVGLAAAVVVASLIWGRKNKE